MALERRHPRLLPTTGKVDARFIAEAINNLFNKRLDAVGEVTLADGETTTVVADNRVTKNSVICRSPTPANAAGALATTYIAAYDTHEFTITHANNSETDRTFRYIILS
jgi:hypothetical protein